MKHCTPKQALTGPVLDLLKKETGIGDFDTWLRVWLLISKSEHDNEDVDGTFEIETNKGSVFGYASELSYDKNERGVTFGLVGWTSKQDGPDLFSKYHELGGPDLVQQCKRGGRALISKIHSLADDDLFIRAQWENLCAKHGYIYETMKSFKKLDIKKPSALAIACLLDCNLNQGYDGKFGGSKNIEKLGTQGDERKTMKDFLKWRLPIADTHDFNQRPNGSSRVKMFQHIFDHGDMDLSDMAVISKALRWNMR